MPLTALQKKIAKLLSINRTEDSYLAGGAALNVSPNSTRYSNDLDYFHDSEERVATAFQADRSLLESKGYAVSVEQAIPGHVRALVGLSEELTKVEWASDSAWRFLPVVKDPDTGFQLHPIDLAVNKILALAGRDEPRDYLDTLECHQKILPVSCLVWAACGKDPGFSPSSLLELIKRRGRYQQSDFDRLNLRVKVDLQKQKSLWLTALAETESFIKLRPPSELGCLYYSSTQRRFVDPTKDPQCEVHYGRPGGVLPKVG